MFKVPKEIRRFLPKVNWMKRRLGIKKEYNRCILNGLIYFKKIRKKPNLI